MVFQYAVVKKAWLDIHYHARSLNIINIYSRYKQDFDNIYLKDLNIWYQYRDEWNREFTIRKNNSEVDCEPQYIRYYCQQNIIKGMLNNGNVYQSLRRFCYTMQGALAVNPFSIKRLYYLANYYEEMAEKLKEDKNAFFKEQIKWLGKSDEEMECIIREAKYSMLERYAKKIDEVLDKLIGDKKEIYLTDEENIHMKMSMRSDLVHIASENEELSKKISGIKKNERGITAETFNAIMREVNLPYEMSGPKKQIFVVSRKVTTTTEN